MSATWEAPIASTRSTSSSRRRLGWREIEVHTVLHQLVVRDLDEQQPMTARSIDDHALLVARLVRIA